MKKFISALILTFSLGIAVGATAADAGEYFFVNNISGDTRLIEMKMLGAHDAFTASLNADSPVDAAGVKLGDSGSKTASSSILWSLAGISTSKAQSAHVEELLNGGVRYFDVRLSRYEEGGEFFTTHGRISDQFTGEGGIARKISAWAAAHPGEIIVLDFQSVFDIETSDGSASQQSWKDLMTKLEADGITNYVRTRNGSILDYTYDDLTDGGGRAAIVLFGQVTGSWADSRYINRRDSDGYMRSLWTETTSYEDLYARLSEEIANIQNNTEAYYYKFRVMQAQTTAAPLIGSADENNIKILTDENFDRWNEILPVLMVDNATTDAGGFNALAVERLAKANRASAGGKYISRSGDVTLSGSNDNVPPGTKFIAEKNGNVYSLALSEGDITGEMTVSFAPSAKRRRVYSSEGEILAETAADGSLEFKTSSLGSYTVIDTEEDAPFAVTKPLLRYTFTDESGLRDQSGSGYDGEALGKPAIGGGKAKLSPDNVIKLPAGLTKNMKNYTASAWVYVNSPVNGGRLFDIGRGSRGSVFARLSSGDTSAGYKNTVTKQASSSAVTAGRWVHVANTYDSQSKTLSLYIDGKKVSSQSAAENPAPDSINDYLNPNGSFIGRTQWHYDAVYAADNPDINADISDFRIYGSVLSAEEISRLARNVTVNFLNEGGEKIADSVIITAGEAYNGYEGYGEEIGNYRFVGIESTSDVDVSDEVNVYYRRAGAHIIVTREGEKAEVALAGDAEGLESCVLIAAVYSGERELAGVKAVPAAERNIEIDCGDGCFVKAFLWKNDMITPSELLSD